MSNIDKHNLQARTELAKIYQRQDKLIEAEEVLIDLFCTSTSITYRLENLIGEDLSAAEYTYMLPKVLKECLSISKNDLNSRTELAKIYQD